MEEDEPARRRTPPWLTALGAVVASTVAVVLVLSVPHLVKARGASEIVPSPGPTAQADPEAPGTRTWQAMDCPPRGQASCAAPLTLDHAGVTFHSVGGARRVVGPGAADRTLTLRLRGLKGDRWVLVGAEHAGSGSSLALGLGRAEVVTVPPGTLSLFPAPNLGQVLVTITERGYPRAGEVLRIEEYRQR